MSGIATGTRLEQLKALRRRLDHEIAIEVRRVIDGPTPARNPVRRPARREVEALTVKRWAVANGLLDEVKRGRVALDLIAAYWEAQG